MDKEIKNRKGQMVIWVIIAVALVATIVLFLFIENKVSVPNEVVVKEINPTKFIYACVQNYVDEVTEIMLPQGGFLNPKHSKLYEDRNVTYLCFNRGNYGPCVNQHPLLLSDMESEIRNYLDDRVDGCFNDLKSELEKRRSEVSMEAMEMNVALGPRRVYVDIEREFVVSKNGASSNFKDFDVEIQSPIYDLGRLAMEITSQESQYCYFEYVGYMILYPNYKISKFPMSDSTIIYSILDKKTEKEMNIAIRGCAIPPGL